jgi:YD repeat-containing protein
VRGRCRSVVAGLLALVLTTGLAGTATAEERAALLSTDEVLELAEALAAEVEEDDGEHDDPPEPAAPPVASDSVPADDPVATTLSALTAPARALAQQASAPDGTVAAGVSATVVATDLGVEVTFSGHEVTEDLAVRIDDLPGGVPATVAATRTGAGLPAGARVLVEPFEVTARATDGTERTRFPTRSTTVPRDGDDQPETDDVVDPGVVLHVPVDPHRSAAVDVGTVRLYTRETADEAWTPVASYLDAATGMLYGELDHLSQFVVIGTPADPDPTPRIVLDPDNDIAHTVSPSGRVTELPFSIALATQTAARFAAACRADVLVTRVDPRQTVLSQRVRAGMAAAFDPDLTVTLAFDAAAGHPWGAATSGGSKVYPGDGASALAAATSLDVELPGYTGRPSHIVGSTLLPYDDLRALPGAVVHLETLYLDHNFDWPVIQDGMPHIADGLFTGLGTYLETQGFDCTDPSLGGWPARPSADDLARWRQLGHQNHQAYGADPVSFSTGNLVEDEPLFTLTGPAGSALDVTLTYNAQDGRPSRVGAGWTFGLGARAQRFADGGVLVVRGDGASFLYEPDGTGGFVADAGNPSTLRDLGDGRLEQTDPDGTRRVFDTTDLEGIGELVQISDRAGATTTLTYGTPDGDDAFLPLTAITDPAGQVIQVQPDGAGRIGAFVLPDGRTWSLGYDAVGDLVAITGPDGRVRSFAYDTVHRMTAATDASGATYLRNAYDAAGRVVEQWDAEGTRRTWAFTDAPDADGLRAVVYTDNEGRPATYRFDGRSRVVEVVDTLGRTERFAYDAADRVVQFIDAAGGATTYGYDGAGNLTTETSPDGTTVRRTYDSFGALTSLTDQGGEDGADRTTTWAYDAQGRVVSVTYPDGTVGRTEYDDAGNIRAETDAAGGVTRYEHDARGNRVATIDPLGARSTATYDATNRLTSTTDATGATTASVWDAGDRLVQQVDPLGGVTRIEHDALDHPVRITDPAGAVTTVTWDDLFRITAVTDPTGAVTRYGYSTEDALLTVTDPLGAVTTYERDAADQVTAVIDPLGGRWESTYDPLGNQLTSSTPSGAVTTYGYDAVGRQVAQTDPTGATRALVHDTVGRVVAEVDPYGATTRYTYDLLDRVVGAVDAAGESETYRYDAAGRLVQTVDRRGQSWTSEIDAAGQVVATTDPLGGTTRYGYDPAGRIASVTDALGATTGYAYDAAGRLVSTTDPLGETRTARYDAAGREVARTDATGATAHRSYDLAGRLLDVTDALGASTGYEYDPAGRQIATVDASGTRSTYAYDLAGQLVEVVEAASSGADVTPVDPVTTRYAYDPDGDLTAITDGRGGTTSFTYDALGRVRTETDATGRTWTSEHDLGGRLTAQVDGRGQRTTYRYDERGDLVETSPLGGTPTTFTYDAAQQPIAMTDGIGATAWAYDEAGRLVRQIDTQGRSLDYGYDAVGQVVSLTLPDHRIVASTFDAAGRTTAQHTPWGSLAHTWDAENRLTATARTEADGSPGITTTAAYDAVGRPVSIAHITPDVGGAAAPAVDHRASTATLLPWRAVLPQSAPTAPTAAVTPRRLVRARVLLVRRLPHRPDHPGRRRRTPLHRRRRLPERPHASRSDPGRHRGRRPAPRLRLRRLRERHHAHPHRRARRAGRDRRRRAGRTRRRRADRVDLRRPVPPAQQLRVRRDHRAVHLRRHRQPHVLDVHRCRPRRHLAVHPRRGEPPDRGRGHRRDAERADRLHARRQRLPYRRDRHR